MSELEEFVYRIPGRSLSVRPGAHRSNSRGPGVAFANYVRLIDQPDPRRLDLRASLKDIKGDWLIRASRQTSAIGVQVIVDVSGSMQFGASRSKLNVAADFLESLGLSAFRYGDALGMLAFDNRIRDDMNQPSRTGRGAGHAMADSLRNLSRFKASGQTPAQIAPARGELQSDTLLECALGINHGSSLVFLVSDFHWPLDRLEAFLEQLSHLRVVPIVLWDKAESTPPKQGKWLRTRDIETGKQRSLWLSEKVRRRWENKVAERRDTLLAAFAGHDIKPYFMEKAFNAEALSRYFIETEV